MPDTTVETTRWIGGRVLIKIKLVDQVQKANCSVEKHDFESECKKIYQSWLQTKKCKNEHKNRKMRERESVCVCVFDVTCNFLEMLSLSLSLCSI